MSISAIVDALLASGATAEQIAAAVRAYDAGQVQSLAEKRAKDAARKRKSREMSHMSHGVTVCPRDMCDITSPDKERSPTPPKEINPSLPSNPDGFSGSVACEHLHAKPGSNFPTNAFDCWWAIYPRKTAKAPAQKAFDRIRRAGTVQFADLMDTTRRFAAAVTDPQFIPHPTTWLNQERWNDDLAHTAACKRPVANRPAEGAYTSVYLRAVAEDDRSRGHGVPGRDADHGRNALRLVGPITTDRCAVDDYDHGSSQASIDDLDRLSLSFGR